MEAHGLSTARFGLLILPGHVYLVNLGRVGVPRIVVLAEPVDGLSEKLDACCPNIVGLLKGYSEKNVVVALAYLVGFGGVRLSAHAHVVAVRVVDVKPAVLAALTMKRPCPVAVVLHARDVEVMASAVPVLHAQLARLTTCRGDGVVQVESEVLHSNLEPRHCRPRFLRVHTVVLDGVG